MIKVTTNATAKVAAVATGLMMAASAFGLASTAHAAALTQTQINAIISLLSSFGADAATIANVQAALTGAPSTNPAPSSCNWTRDLTIGSKGADVTALQNWLIAGGYSIPAGATGYFGTQTQAAVAAWQKASGITPAAGYFGPKSRAAAGCSSTTPTTPITGNGLKVMLSPTSPNNTALVQGQGIGDLADFVFTNPTSAAVTVTSLTFNRTGISNDSAINNVYLYNGVTRITDSAGISSSQFSFTDAGGVFVVPALGSVTISVRADIAGSTAGQIIGVALVSVSSSGTLDSSVVFPINGGFQTVASATLATVDWSGTVTPSAAITISAQNDYPVWQENVSVSTNPVKLQSLRFTNLGSADSSAIVSARLYVDGVQVGTTLPTLGADRTATFDLSAAPVTLSTSSHVIKILANITNGAASRTVQFSLQRSSDSMFIDSQLNQPVTVTAASATFSAQSSAIVTVQYASNAGVSVSRDPASPTENIAVGASNQKWATFDMLASGENVKVTDLWVVASSTKSTGALDGVGGLNDGKIFLNGVQVGSTKDLAQGTTGAARSAATDFTFGSSLILPAGVTAKVDVYADAKDTAGTNLSNSGTVKIYLIAGSSNGQGQSSLTSTNVPAAETSSNTITVSSSSLTATKYSGYGNQTIIAGQNAAKIGSFTLSTGSTEGVTVNTIGIQFANAVSSTITNLTLKDQATGSVVGTTITTPGSTADAVNSFAVNVNIPVSSTKTFDVYADVLSGANNGTLAAKVDVTTSGTGNTTGTTASVASDVTLQTMTLGSGLLTVTTGAGDPVSSNIIAGASSVQVGQYQFAAANSSWTVQKLDVLIPNGAATSVGNVTVQYKDAAGTTQTATQALTISGNNAYATASFTGLTMYVPNNDSANVDVFVSTPTVASGAASGAPVRARLSTGTTGTFRAIDSAGTATTSISSGTDVNSGGTHYVRKSIPTFAMLSPGGSTSAPANPLYRFTISADAAAAIDWTELVFNIATTSATVTNVYLVDESTGLNVLDSNTTSASTTATTISVNLTQNATQPTYQQVAAGATKTYGLYGTVTGFTTGSTITLSLAADTSTTANAASASVSGSTVWSDRSANSHSITTTDWTNGYLLKNFTTNTTTYSK